VTMMTLHDIAKRLLLDAGRALAAIPGPEAEAEALDQTLTPRFDNTT
jgi:hypothetical protein